jgi:hypothetical protein
MADTRHGTIDAGRSWLRAALTACVLIAIELSSTGFT